jgi:hypothetical protein
MKETVTNWGKEALTQWLSFQCDMHHSSCHSGLPRVLETARRAKKRVNFVSFCQTNRQLFTQWFKKCFTGIQFHSKLNGTSERISGVKGKESVKLGATVVLQILLIQRLLNWVECSLMYSLEVITFAVSHQISKLFIQEKGDREPVLERLDNQKRRRLSTY